jgi:Uma2 family endonuclease
MSVRTAEKKRLTAQDLWAMGDEADHCELDEGRLIRMPPAGPRHGKVASKLSTRIENFVEQHGLGDVYAADTGFTLAPDTVRAPDVSFVRTERIPKEGLPEEGYFPGSPDLAVEVLSARDWEHPGTFQRKIAQYLEAGTRLVWVLDRRKGTVVVYRADGSVEVIGRDGALSGEEVLPGFTCQVGEVLPAPEPEAGPSPARPQPKSRGRKPAPGKRR